MLVERYPRTAGAALRDPVAESLDEVRMAAVMGIAQRHEKAARRELVDVTIGVIVPAPGIHIDSPILGNRQMTGMPQMIREHGRAESRRQAQAAIPSLALRRLRREGPTRQETRKQQKYNRERFGLFHRN